MDGEASRTLDFSDTPMKPLNRIIRSLGGALAVLALVGDASASANWRKTSPPSPTCASFQRARQRRGERRWPHAGYNRQPLGHQNYMITIGPGGKMTALRRCWRAAHQFAKVQPGMDKETVRRLRASPPSRWPLCSSRKPGGNWNWIDPPSREMVFHRDLRRQRAVRAPPTWKKLRDGELTLRQPVPLVRGRRQRAALRPSTGCKERVNPSVNRA